MEKIILRKPLTVGDKEIKELQLDLDNMTGNDVLQAEAEARVLGEMAPDMQFSKKFQAIVAAKVAGISYDDIISLAAPDFMQVVNTVSNFLFGWVLPVNTQENK